MSFGSVKGLKRLTDEFYRQNVLFLWFLFKRQRILQQLKGMQSSKQGMWKGYHLSIEGIRKGYLFRKKWYIKGQGFRPQGRTSPYKNLLSTPPPAPGARVDCIWRNPRTGMIRSESCVLIGHPSILPSRDFPLERVTSVRYKGSWL